MMKDIDAHLDEVLGIVETPQRDVAKTEKVKPLVNGQEDETDFQYARENLYNLIERGQDGLEELLEIAKQSQHPRAFEVVGQMIDKLANTNKELLNLHKTKKDIQAEKTSGPTNVTNALFVGSTSELQKLLKGKTDG
jgi:hypothetical protein|tara:strand:+ start:138 stop:548 length:411 start_codon:yes stop_codon:yes gene_type:complete